MSIIKNASSEFWAVVSQSLGQMFRIVLFSDAISPLQLKKDGGYKGFAMATKLSTPKK
jgi:hypothetical protein